MICWSYGGGVQSVGIAVLVRQGRLPKPDVAVIADTSRERKATWQYMREHVQPLLAEIGLEIKVASHELASCDLYDRKGDLPILPAYSGQEGRLPAYCSGEWKRDVFERHLRLLGVKECTQWLGYSTDERWRATGKAHRPWCVPAYPLIDLGISRRGCLALIAKAGLPEPSKSRCWMCPHQSNDEWREVRDDPEEWGQAVALDRAIREADERKCLYLHSSRVPLELADLGQPGDDMPLFRHCQDAGCFT